MRHHELKINNNAYELVATGDKLFEIRDNDRMYQRGDTVTLRWFDAPPTKMISIRGYDDAAHPPLGPFEITCVCDYMQKRGYVVLGLRKVGEYK